MPGTRWAPPGLAAIPGAIGCVPEPQQATRGRAVPHAKTLRHERVSQGLPVPQDGPGAPPGTRRAPPGAAAYPGIDRGPPATHHGLSRPAGAELRPTSAPPTRAGIPGATAPQEGPGAPPGTRRAPLRGRRLPAHSRAWGDHQGAVPPRQRPPWGKIPAWRVSHGLTHKAVNFFWAGAPLAEGPHASAPAHVCAQASQWFALKSPLQKYTFSPAL